MLARPPCCPCCEGPALWVGGGRCFATHLPAHLESLGKLPLRLRPDSEHRSRLHRRVAEAKRAKRDAVLTMPRREPRSLDTTWRRPQDGMVVLRPSENAEVVRELQKRYK